MAKRARRPIGERFWSKVDKRGPDDCWLWAGRLTNSNRNKEHYGRFDLADKSIMAHVFAFLNSGGILTDEKPLVLHACDNPPCCNPRHLRAGDAKDNADDMVARNRHKSLLGEQHPGHKLTEDQARTVAKMLRDGHTQSAIGRLLGVTHATIYFLQAKKTWKHLDLNMPPLPGRGANPPTKITAAQVSEIKRLLAAGQQLTKLAKMFDVSIQNICHISKGRTWKHVL